MKMIRILSAFALAAGLGACAQPDTATRNATLSPDTPAPTQAAQDVVLQPKYHVKSVAVTVPHSLRVSEANVFFPIADIVWRGEPRGDRYAQVKKIFEDGFKRGTRGMKKGPAVVVKVEVTRFHILTEKAKAFTGGTYDMRFLLTVVDARSGKVLDGPRLVSASMQGVGGRKALDLEARGITQRVMIVAHLSDIIRQELSAPVETPAPAQVSSRGPFNPSTL